MEFYCKDGIKPRFELILCKGEWWCPFKNPKIEIISPAKGDKLEVEETYEIAWDQVNIDRVHIGYKSCESCLDWIEFNMPVDVHEDSGSYLWTVPEHLVPGEYQIYISGFMPQNSLGTSGQVSDLSGVFNILPSSDIEVQRTDEFSDGTSIIAGTDDNEVFKLEIGGSENRDFSVNAITFQMEEKGVVYQNIEALLVGGGVQQGGRQIPDRDGMIRFENLVRNMPIERPWEREYRLFINTEESSLGKLRFNLIGMEAGISDKINDIESSGFYREFFTVMNGGEELSASNPLEGAEFELIEEKIIVYEWEKGEWGECSVKCGRGTRMREWVCMGSDGVAYDDISLCGKETATESEECNIQPCIELLTPPIITVKADSYEQVDDNSFEVSISDYFFVKAERTDETPIDSYKLSYYTDDGFVFPDEIVETAEGFHTFGAFSSSNVTTWTFHAQVCKADRCSEPSSPLYVHMISTEENLILWPDTGSSGEHDLFDIMIVTDVPEEDFEKFLEITFGNGDFSLFATDPLSEFKQKFNIYYYRMPTLDYENTDMCVWGVHSQREEAEFFDPIFNQYPWVDLKLSVSVNSYVWPHAYPPVFNQDESLQTPSRINIGMACDVNPDFPVVLVSDERVGPKIVVHEIGHGFGNLIDEYNYSSWEYNFIANISGIRNCVSYINPVSNWDVILGWDGNLSQGCFVNYYCESELVCTEEEGCDYEGADCTSAFRGTENSMMKNQYIYNTQTWRNAWGPINRYYLLDSIEGIDRGNFDRQ